METFLPFLLIAKAAVISLPLGYYMYRIMEPAPKLQQDWKAYSVSLLVFNSVMFIFSWLVLAFQHRLPLNPDGKGALEPTLIFNTAASFVTNTNLQHYSGEQHLSYFSQLFMVCWNQFVSAGTGIAALAALCRAISGKTQVGNFFSDLFRAVFLILLPLSLLIGAGLIAWGVPMTLEGAAAATTLEGVAQTIARGPVAAIVSIKQLGTNGGGYFGPNSAHPFENPNHFSNLIELFCVILIPMASVWMFGRLARRRRDAVVIFSVMLILLLAVVICAIGFEGSPANLEGKELRFSPFWAPVWAAMTTATSNGSVNCMHDSLNPLTGLVPFMGMWLNVIFGGVGVGFINMFLYVLVAVFICGLMVGRTPEYANRKVEGAEMKLILIAFLLHPFLILGGTALFAATAWGAKTVANPGSHGFSEILYEFSSAAANNGSGFEGLADNSPPWNIATGIVMLLARFIPILAPLAVGGLLAAKKPTPETSGTFRTDTALFGSVLLGTIILVGALFFMPVAVLGPLAEHLSLGGFPR